MTRRTQSRSRRRSGSRRQSQRRRRSQKSRRIKSAPRNRSRNSRRRSKRNSRRRSTKRSRSTRRSRSRSRSQTGSPRKTSDEYSGNKNAINDYFDKIYIINLADKTERFTTVTKQFRTHKIKYSRFNAIDGRCLKAECSKKKKLFKEKYGLTIARNVKAPVASLVVGTVEILREMVKNKWDRILICEDDINFGKDLLRNFSQGIKELEEEDLDWDQLYLGSGGPAGKHGISDKKTKKNKYLTSWAIADPDLQFYVEHKDDLRIPCEDGDCEHVSKHLTRSWGVGGTWCYAYSLQGAKKVLTAIGTRVTDHIDQLLMKFQRDGKMMALCFDPPIVYHEGGAIRADSSLDW
jgi:GR25 family glycosyltransferase involved in LPS biosynthesis